MTDAIRVLHVDDEPDFAEMVAALLQRETDRFDVRTATSVSEGLDTLTSNEFDCVVSDHDMPEQTGVEFLAAVREEWPDLPFILFTGKGSEEVASKAISAGASEYLQKESGSEQYSVLANRIINTVEKYRAQRTVERRERRFHALLKHSPDRLSIADEEARYQFVSPAMKRLMGYGPDALLGVSGFEYVHPDDENELRALFERVVDGSTEEGTAIYRYRHANGSWRWVESRLRNRLDDPAVDGIIFNSRDVTPREHGRRELRAERQFIDQALDALDEIFYVVGMDGSLRRWNASVIDVSGYSQEQVTDMAVVDFFAEDHRERIANAIEETLESGRAVVEADVLTADGERISYEFTGTRLTDPEGNFTGIAGVGRDISERP